MMRASAIALKPQSTTAPPIYPTGIELIRSRHKFFYQIKPRLFIAILSHNQKCPYLAEQYLISGRIAIFSRFFGTKRARESELNGSML